MSEFLLVSMNVLSTPFSDACLRMPGLLVWDCHKERGTRSPQQAYRVGDESTD